MCTYANFTNNSPVISVLYSVNIMRSLPHVVNLMETLTFGNPWLELEMPVKMCSNQRSSVISERKEIKYGSDKDVNGL